MRYNFGFDEYLERQEENYIAREDVMATDAVEYDEIAYWMQALQEAINADKMEDIKMAMDELCGYLDCKYILNK